MSSATASSPTLSTRLGKKSGTAFRCEPRCCLCTYHNSSTVKDPFDDWELDESALPSSTSAHGPVDTRAEEAAQKRAFDLKLKRFM